MHVGAIQVTTQCLAPRTMKRSHRIIFFLIAVLALATFAFGVMMLIGK
jgi:hypothetical protein